MMVDTDAKAKLIAEDGKFTLTLDPGVVVACGLSDGDELRVSVTGGELRVSKSDPERRRKFQAALDETNELYADALKRLAE